MSIKTCHYHFEIVAIIIFFFFENFLKHSLKVNIVKLYFLIYFQIYYYSLCLGNVCKFVAATNNLWWTSVCGCWWVVVSFSAKNKI